MIGLVGIGKLAFADVPALTRVQHTYAPEVENAGVYDEAFSRFKLAYRQLAPFYRKLNRRGNSRHGL